MKTKPRKPRDDDSLFEILRILVFVQVAVAVVTGVEAVFMGISFGAVGTSVVTMVAAIITVWLYIGLGRRSPRARKWLIRVQIAWITIGVIDLLLAIFVAQRFLEPIPLLTRFVLPYAIFRMLRTHVVQAEFWQAPSPESLIEEEVIDRVPAMA